jgi:hypothetical protein
MKRNLAVLSISIALLTLAGCTGSADTATVTIRIGDIPLAAESQGGPIDTLLAILTLAKPALADPPDGQSGVNYMTLTVTGDGMQTIDVEIPLTTGEVTLDIPVGPARTFEANAYYDSEGTLFLYYFGKATVDVSPGDDIVVPITMIQVISQ